MEIEECVDLFLKKVTPVSEIERVRPTEACGRVVANTVRVEQPVPAFPKSAMDGYAVRAADIADASKEQPVVLNVLGENCAGDCNELSYISSSAVRVMTGAYIPEGFDAVIRQEDTDYGMDKVTVYASVKPYANYCKIGEDMKVGETVLERNWQITPLHIGLLASIGEQHVNVYRRLRVALISTGSELVPMERTVLKKGEIYNSILYILKSAVEREGFVVSYEKVCADEEPLLERMLLEAADCADVVITTGGVSVGKKDLLPAVLEKAGAQRLFTRANIQPGTPTIGSILNGKPVLSLSGNPYAAIVNFEIYFWELAAAMTHRDSLKPVVTTAVLKSEYSKVNRLRRFVRAYEENGEVFLPTQTHASSVISNMTQCNCYLDIAAGTALSVGDTVTVRKMRLC